MRRRQILALNTKSAPAFSAMLETMPPEGKFYDDMSDADLKAAFEVVTGHKPHWKMKRATILEKLYDARNDSA